jgi:sugar/nucleoside kinase (ribokinase family)
MPSVLVVGSVAFDSIKSPFGEVREAVGGSAMYFSTSASYFSDVRLVAVVGEDYPEAELDDLRGRGVDLDGLIRAPGKTFRWKGEYGADLNEAKTLETHLNVFEHFSPELPAHYRDSEYVFLGNIMPELQLQVLEQVKAPKLVAADTMNLWINGSRAALEKVLARVDLLFVNDTEARTLAGTANIVQAAQRIRAMGPKRLIVKRGEYGALLFDDAGTFFAPAYPLESVFDPTGAGDSFGGGFMGYVARQDSLDRDTLCRGIVVGSVMASYCVERFSLERLRQLGPHLIEARYKQFRDLTHFTPLEPLVHGPK